MLKRVRDKNSKKQGSNQSFAVWQDHYKLTEYFKNDEI